MADAAPSGGGGWTAIEIIIVLILAIAVLSRIRGVSPSIINEPKVPTTASKRNDPYLSPYVSPATEAPTTTLDPRGCGITVLRPKPLEKVSGFVRVTGTVSGCEWETTETVAVYAQVIDSRGRPVSDYVAIPVEGRMLDSTTFSGTVELRDPNITGTGTLILLSATTNSDNIQATARIPIKF